MTAATGTASGRITSIDALRERYAPPGERAVRKQLAALDAHCRRFISLSPLLVVSSASSGGRMDASPRGGDPGFVKVLDDGAILIPDSPGNNRFDTLANIIETGRAGLLFLVPGVDETLRVNGTAELRDDPELLELARSERRLPKLVIRIGVEEAYLHCAKALMRSKLWARESLVERSVLPTMGRMINDQAGLTDVVETQEQMIERYRRDL
jgi:PPOX class probable FMN-dependent enzyme